MNISVLMSVYHSEKPSYLQRSLQSIWDDQTLKPAQIVLIKDGPLPKELEIIIERWVKRLPNIMTILSNEYNIGLTKSLNKGLKETKGDLIARMDTDDISLPYRFELQHKFLTEHPEIAVCGGWLQEFNDHNTCLNIRHYPSDIKLIRKYICKASPLAHPTVMIRASVFSEKSIHYNENYRTSQDIALWFDILYAGLYISNIQEVTILFRRADDVFKRRGRDKALNEFLIYTKGIYKLYGFFSWRYIFPISRLLFRFMPISIIKIIYESGIRRRILERTYRQR